MVIVMKPDAPMEVVEKIEKKMESLGCIVHRSQGENHCLLGLVGDTRRINPSQIEANVHVEKLLRVQQPFKLANRSFHPEDTVIDVEGHKIGGGHTAVIAGPCSVESEEQLMLIARSVKASGAKFLRGGAV